LYGIILLVLISFFCTPIQPTKQQYLNDYFPLAYGNYWVYNIIDSAGNVTGIDSVIINDSSSWNNHKIYIQSEYISFINTANQFPRSCYFDSGNDVCYTNCWYLNDSLFWKTKIAQHTYQEGDSWNAITLLDSVVKFNVDFVGTVSTPYGNISNCLKVLGNIFGPDIGLIKTDNKILIRYSLNKSSQAKAMKN
ncbi:MAG: hypothetical protein PHG23_02770, partial [Candidatus Pacebacteria bacterium]|nr:hypothetical protein [Candidatus Paceibacterota bacterium]